MRRRILTITLALATFACAPAYAEGTFSTFDANAWKVNATGYPKQGVGPDHVKRGVVDLQEVQAGAAIDTPTSNITDVALPDTFKPLPYEGTYKPISLDQVLVFKYVARPFNRSVFEGAKQVRGHGEATNVRGR